MYSKKLVQSTLIATIVTIVFVVIVTILGELYTVSGADGKVLNPIKEFLKALHGHHWVGKSIWATGVFGIANLLTYLYMRLTQKEFSLTCLTRTTTYILSIGILALYGFFIYEYIIAH